LRPAVEKTVRELNLSEAVIFTGRVPFQQVPSYIRRVDVAVIPHTVDEHTNHTIPHKLFQYIALGKPVVASNIVPIRRILEETGAGIIVSEWSPREFADGILCAQKRLRAGDHNPQKQQAVLRAKYGIQELREPLLRLYQSLEDGRNERAVKPEEAV
jgi:glycosyltransferase involved in cell wall biosynthesis